MELTITQTKINGAEINSVDARELHKTLGVKKAFTTWIKSNLEAIGAIKDEDYVILKSSLEGSGYKKVFIVSADIAKHLAMMSKTENAKKVRDYFIEVEEQSKVPMINMDDVVKSLQLTAQGLKYQDERLDQHHEKIVQLENYVEEDIKSRPVSYSQQKALMDAKNKKVYEIAPHDQKLQTALHRKVWQVFKKNFQLPRYSELRAVKYDEGIWFINNLSIADLV